MSATCKSRWATSHSRCSGASERGDGEAAFCLGCLYLTGWRVPLDVDQAGRWFLAARDLGHPLAEAQLPAELSAVAGAAPLWRGLLERAAQGGAVAGDESSNGATLRSLILFFTVLR